MFIFKKHPVADLPQKFEKLVIFRSLIGTLGFALQVFAIEYLPLFIVVIVVNTSTFISSALGYFINGEKIQI